MDKSFKMLVLFFNPFPMKKFLISLFSFGLFLSLAGTVFAFAYEGDCSESWIESDWQCIEDCGSHCAGSITYNSCDTICRGNNFCNGCEPCPSNQERHPDTGVCIYNSDASCRGAFGEGATYDGNGTDGCTCIAPSYWDGSYCWSGDQQCGEGQILHSETGNCIWSSNTWCERAFGEAYYDGNGVDGCACKEGATWDGSLCSFPGGGSGVFTDTGGHRYETAINYVYNNGIVNGYPDGSYGPDRAINRAEFTKIIMGSSFDSSVLTGSDCFPDVGNDWFAPYVCAAQSMGIIGGYPNGRFEPNNNINLAESLKIIFEGAGVDVPETGGPWYQKYVDLASQMGLLNTINSDPAHNLTRGEMAELIYIIGTM